MRLPSLRNIQIAHEKIQAYVHHTPVMSSRSIDHIVGGKLFFKCENFQKVGAFKFRGASNAVLSLSSEDAKKGVATHSSGNHGAALALAARNKGMKSVIVMPRTSPMIKQKAVAGYGAEIVFCEPTLQSREESLKKVVEETGAVFIHPYNNFNIVCGQGTAALELCAEAKDLDIVIAPVGGGGLLSGTATAVKGLSPKINVFGAEPAGADDAYRSFKSGQLQPSINPQTIADGLLTSLSDFTFAIINDKVDDIVTTGEQAIIEAMRMIWERMKIIVEPSAAVPLACLLENKIGVAGKRVGIILSGGNVDLNHLPF